MYSVHRTPCLSFPAVPRNLQSILGSVLHIYQQPNSLCGFHLLKYVFQLFTLLITICIVLRSSSLNQILQKEARD